MDRVTITINPAGETQIAVNGVAGPSCKDLTRQIESALGETISDTKTAEYSQRPRLNAQNSNRA